MADNNQQWPDLPWNIKLFLSILSFVVDINRCCDRTVNSFLMSFFDLRTFPSKKPINGGVKTSDIAVERTKILWFRLYIPTANNTTPSAASNGAGLHVIFFFHDGGFTYFAPDSKFYDDFCYRLAGEFSAFIISVNYRLAPEHRCPTQYEDSFHILKFIESTQIKGFSNQANLKHCFLLGDSAGGKLAHHVALKASEHEFSRIELIGNILNQPFFGGEERTESELRLTRAPFISMELTDWIWRAFLPKGDNRDHQTVNVFGPNSIDISKFKFPKTIIFVGGYDPLQDWVRSYYEGLRKSTKEVYFVEYPNAMHTFYLFPELPECSSVIKAMRDFMQSNHQGWPTIQFLSTSIGLNWNQAKSV
ncbi:hypothetical protein P3X46_021898 [Hevea brasiliensis]|uniref:Alpha/beta hydrolase fold-3 domain-containing protein n=1 Tax=Hevea brasiliensis TaxID=3981 RepID=A0ABQ9LJ00_HEVBR|nr:probable carboxylesterase 18 [Hevea brasiliensis]KAJ9167232.1 hypothetical protein P3X46_021898 [Hevea brasiliensis]